LKARLDHDKCQYKQDNLIFTIHFTYPYL